MPLVDDDDMPGPDSSSASLERRLPLMISALLAVTIAAFGIIAFSEVRQTSLAAATGQLRTVIAQAAENSTRGVVTRLEVLNRLATDRSIARAIAEWDSEAADSIARTLLRSRIVPTDTITLVAQLLSGEPSTRRVMYGSEPTPTELAALDSTIADARRRDSTAISPFFESRGGIHYWMAAPVRQGSKLLGFFAEHRQVRTNSSVEKQLKALTGQDFSVYFTSGTGELWTTAAGTPMKPRFDVSAQPDSFRVQSTDGEWLMGVKTTIRTTPWIIIFTTTQSAVNQRSVMFLRFMLVIAAILLSIGVLGARWVSRKVTRPLLSLTLAAQDIARGDYGRRQRVHSNDEIGQLARAFNLMAERIGQSREQLQGRILESEALTRELQQRNSELQVAQHVATEARLASDRARADAQRASTAKSEFLAMMSHELRTPLSAIAGYAEILQLGIRGELNAAQRADIARIQSNQVHLLRIINDILDLTQVESGQMAIASQPVVTRDVLADVEPIVLPLIADRAIEYRVEPEGLDAVAMAERERLTQVLVNLVANAVRFTEAGGVITVAVDASDDAVSIRVSDTGIGIPPDKQEQVFQPFVQADSGPSRRAQGTGLGLAISRRLVEAMGGALTLTSEVGVGSTFTVTLVNAMSPAKSDAVI